MYPQGCFGKVILFDSTMIDRYKKLVAVAEDMATRLQDAGVHVDGCDVHVENERGIVRLGLWVVVGSTYCSEDNIFEPEFEIDYRTYHFYWSGEEWKEEIVVEIVEEDYDELPF